MTQPPPQQQERTLLEAIRNGTAPSHVKREASRGQLPVAAEELLEILVLLAQDSDPTCSEVAKQSLAGWPVEKCAALLKQPDASLEALAYFASQSNLPDSLVEVIGGHPKAGNDALTPLAARLPLPQVKHITEDENRLSERPGFVAALLQRRDLPPDLRRRLESLHGKQEAEQKELAAALAREEEGEAEAPPEQKRERISLTQKVARMSVSERIQAALKGDKDTRLILIRDPSKMVYRAVLQSPKLSDGEVENIATMKNVAEEVLRIIANTRQFAKNYIVIRNLANNPRTAIDVSMGLINRLTNPDLKTLSQNRNVPETIRSVALKLYKQRTETRQGGGGGH